jgi:hypothetical protein
MHDWDTLFDRELPEPLSTIAEWLATGEKLVHSGLELDNKSDVEAMKYMERTVSYHHVRFLEFQMGFLSSILMYLLILFYLLIPQKVSKNVKLGHF